MNQVHMDSEFSRALRATLVSQVKKTAPARSKRRRRLWLGAAVLAGTGTLGTIGAAATGLLVLPGVDTVTRMAAPVTETFKGSGTIELGDVPEGATHVSLELTCLTAGTFEFEDGSSMTCSQADLDGPSNVSSGNVPLAPGQHTTRVRTGPKTSWQVTATYVSETPTEWGINSNGDTYGVQNDQGSPDLIAVMASNGKQGYVYNEELNTQPDFKSPEEAIAWQESMKGKNIMIPVYEADGETVVGEFEAGRW